MRDDPERVLDILEAIERIEKVAVRGRDYFYNDEMAQVWVIHHLLILGEAVRGISPEFRDRNPGIPWSDIIGLRNILIHHYFGIDRDAVWNVVEHDLPVLKKQVQSLVQE
ncbi:HepT-like ribonuclease domain-containing protein [Methanosphaerula subterraneus]|uniref:HepT-like ribonuclease domain-containing protein n=1 Tax=Methanosphaerula subterraneus TaxID=3350244 RepID=UPI003F8786BD